MSAIAPALTPVAHWHTEHMYFRRLLDLLQAQVDKFHTGEHPNYELMVDIITYLREYTDKVHHPREDVAFARLAEHCPEMRQPLARLAQQHRIIAVAGEALARHLDAIMDEAIVPRAEVEAAAATFLVYYGNHIAEEEREILGRCAAALTSEDWDAVRDAAPPLDDPLFGRGPAEGYRELRRAIARRA